MSTSLSNIIASIDENYPIQGQDNPSQGFRDNFDSIKTALEQVNTKITELETSTAQGILVEEDDGVILNNYQGNVVRNAIIDYSSLSYNTSGNNLVGTSVNLDLTQGMVQKIGITGNTTLQFINWPSISTEPRYHKFILHVNFNISETDPSKFERKLYFTTQTGGIIKGCDSLEYEMTDGKPYWYLKPSITLGAETKIYNIDGFGIVSPIGDTDTTIPVISTEGFPSSGILIIDNEQITYQNKNQTSFLNCTRGANSTTAVIHNHDTKVQQLISNIIADYEYVLEISSYDGGTTVFVNYINKFIGK